jgi:hypothetical protein
VEVYGVTLRNLVELLSMSRKGIRIGGFVGKVWFGWDGMGENSWFVYTLWVMTYE